MQTLLNCMENLEDNMAINYMTDHSWTIQWVICSVYHTEHLKRIRIKFHIARFRHALAIVHLLNAFPEITPNLVKINLFQPRRVVLIFMSWHSKWKPALCILQLKMTEVSQAIPFQLMLCLYLLLCESWKVKSVLCALEYVVIHCTFLIVNRKTTSLALK